ncbi:MAG TPA: hypothetical protein DCF68_15845 [Cyanothece sp. UBA12306]|nr:hypothetical protein [Cyanothece sp. UBA12306]
MSWQELEIKKQELEIKKQELKYRWILAGILSFAGVLITSIVTAMNNNNELELKRFDVYSQLTREIVEGCRQESEMLVLFLQDISDTQKEKNKWNILSQSLQQYIDKKPGCPSYK